MKLNETTETIQCSSKRMARTQWGLIGFNKTTTRFYLIEDCAGVQAIMGCHPFVCREVFPAPNEREQILNAWRDGKTNSPAVRLLYPDLEYRN